MVPKPVVIDFTLPIVGKSLKQREPMSYTIYLFWCQVTFASCVNAYMFCIYSFIPKKFCKWLCRCQHLLHRLLPLPRCWRARSFSAAAKWDFGRLCHCLQECPSTLSHFAKYLIQPTSLPSVLWFTAQHFLLETCDLSDLWGFVIWGHLLLPHFQGVLDLKYMWMRKRKRRLLQGTTVAAGHLGHGLGSHFGELTAPTCQAWTGQARECLFPLKNPTCLFTSHAQTLYNFSPQLIFTLFPLNHIVWFSSSVLLSDFHLNSYLKRNDTATQWFQGPPSIFLEILWVL